MSFGDNVWQSGQTAELPELAARSKTLPELVPMIRVGENLF